MKTLQAFSLGLALVAAQLAAAQTERPRIVVETATANSVTAVAFSPDGRFLASANADKTVKLWNLAAGRRHLTLQGHEAAVNAVAFSQDGNTLASGGADKTIRLWDASTGRQTATLAGHAEGVSSVSFGRGGLLLASGAGSEIKIWDTAGGREVRSLAGHARGVFAVAFAADGKTLVSGSPDSVRVWDVETGVNQKTFTDLARPFTAVAVSRDGKHVAGGVSGAAIGLWDVASGVTVRQFTGHAAAVASLAFDPEGKLLAGGGADGSLKLWDVTTGAPARALSGHASQVRSAAFSHDGKLLASGDGGPETKLRGVAGGRELASLVAPDERNWIVFTPVGLYDGTPGGMRSVNFKQAGQSIQIDAFFEQLYTPKLLAQVVLSNRADSTRPYPTGAFGGLLGRVSGGGARPPMSAPSPSTSASSPSTSASSPSSRRAGGFGTMHATRRLGLDLTGAIKLPPRVKIELPADAAPPALQRGADAGQPQSGTRGIGQEFASADLATLKVTATDQGGGVEEIRIYRNDKLIIEDKLARDRERGPAPAATPAATPPTAAPDAAPTVTKSYSVALAPGSNVFRAVALNADRTESSPAEVKMERAAAQATVTLHLLAVGLNEYKNPKYNLNFGRADAQSFADELERRGRGIFKAINKHVLLDREATRESVEAAFAHVAATAQPGDAFVFFYAGHGVMSEGTPAAPAEFHLVPHDVTQLYGNDEMLAAKGVAAGLLREWCRRIPAQKQLIVLDACQAGGAVDAFSTLRGVPEEKAIMQLARSVGIIILAATGTEQLAVEFAKLGHGAFTYALLQGLSGQADGGSQPDGKITVKELEAYLNDTLPELTRLHRGTPQFPNSYSRGQDFPLGVK